MGVTPASCCPTTFSPLWQVASNATASAASARQLMREFALVASVAANATIEAHAAMFGVMVGAPVLQAEAKARAAYAALGNYALVLSRVLQSHFPAALPPVAARVLSAAGGPSGAGAAAGAAAKA